MNKNSKPVDVSDDAVKHTAAEWKSRMDAGLSVEEREQLRLWCQADERHRAALQRFDAVWDRFDRPFNAGAADELLEELDRRSSRRNRSKLGLALSVGLVLILVSFWQGTRPAHTSVGDAVPEVAILRLPSRQVLEDGSIVELKEGAAISVDYSAQRRRVTLLRGEGYFQVVRDVNRPFSVQAGGVVAEALGTAFTVDLRSQRVEVLVTSGKVAVKNSEPDAGVASPTTVQTPDRERTLFLDGGKSCVVGMGESVTQGVAIIEVQEREIDARLAWRAPRVEFTRARLADAVEVLNRYAADHPQSGRTAKRFVVEDSSLADVQVSGLFRIDKTDVFVSLLENGFGITAQDKGPDEIRLRRGDH